MDFPKSVPGIGLVGDRFVDENPVTGQQGSLIASAWGNQVTDELLNVMAAAQKVSDTPDELAPSEEKSNQLLTAIQTLITDSMPESLSGWGDIGDKPIAINAMTNVVTVTTSSTLTNEQLGFILIDASNNDVAVTLPASTVINQGTRVRLFRVDNSTHKVTIKAATNETILFNTHLNNAGYNFFYLFGAGDYWELLGIGSSCWTKTCRLDDTPLGRVSYDASILTPIGGSLIANGTLLSRTEYPWLWDHAQQSGMLVDSAKAAAKDGCFTTGDGANTFRIPDLRGLFLRAFDSDRGVDIAREAGSYQGDAIRNITGNLNFGVAIHEANGVFALGGGGRGGVGSDRYSNTLSLNASRQVPTATENRPVNVAYPLYLKII